MARYLDIAAIESPLGGPPPDFLSHSHGEGFLRFFEERFRNQALYLLDEPESALSPTRQIEFMKFLRSSEASAAFQIVMATHSPLLMAYPDAWIYQFDRDGVRRVSYEETEHYRVTRDLNAFFD